MIRQFNRQVRTVILKPWSPDGEWGGGGGGRQNLLDMQIPGPHSRPTESQLGEEPSSL